MHRTCDLLVKQRTQIVNMIRGMLAEFGICAAKPIKPISRAFGLTTQPLEFATRPADDIEIDPL